MIHEVSQDMKPSLLDGLYKDSKNQVKGMMKIIGACSSWYQPPLPCVSIIGSFLQANVNPNGDQHEP